jgi:site-specific recombinase XerD
VLLPLTPEAVAGLQECRERTVVSSRWVFVQDNGQPYSVTTLKRHFAKAKELAGITRRVRFHDLRHSVSSRIVSRGVDITVVRDVLAHSSVVTTQRYARSSAKARQAQGCTHR